MPRCKHCGEYFYSEVSLKTHRCQPSSSSNYHEDSFVNPASPFFQSDDSPSTSHHSHDSFGGFGGGDGGGAGSSGGWDSGSSDSGSSDSGGGDCGGGGGE